MFYHFYHNLYFKLATALLWSVGIWYLMIMPLPDSGLPEASTHIIDKFIHVFLFGVLTMLVWRLLKLILHNTWARLTWSFALVWSYAYLTEFMQSFSSGRTPSAWDLIWGTVGILLALTVIWHYRESKPKLLVHLCCGPCGAGAIRDLKRSYAITLLFANSNIDTAEEHQRRWRAAKTLANHHGLRLIKSTYTHDAWLKQVKGHEAEPERGSRCQICYRYRMNEAAVTAKAYGFDYFTSSLSDSPYKDNEAVMQIGQSIAKTLGVKFLDFNFSANDGYRKSISESKKLKLYRQKYCGCEFSKGHLKKN
jgi:hypothetical protein